MAVVDAGNRSRVHGDARLVGHGVRVEPAADGAHVHRGLAHDGCVWTGKWKSSSTPMTFAIFTIAFSPSSGIEPWAVTPWVSISNQARPLCRCKDSSRWARDHDRAGAVEQALVGEVASAFAADLLAGGEHERHARRCAQVRRELDRGGDDRRNPALHVGRAAPVERSPSVSPANASRDHRAAPAAPCRCGP
jgi:hypothetical protein